ncbi:hypothetical protein DFH05DRAFT_1529025 [Lentinula detonsa]|uniref:Alcohol dehydrogenase-like N-terminal domain-containing protein n=1 Tax=Lentinula detonsa TaxID=2804962 RepID=A0A9W8NT77_9AGAR|nr:hypothetical protein DFH05DRAFT_1529025 [Lentinula detonsa]
MPKIPFVLKTGPLPKPGPGEARAPFAPNPAIIGYNVAGDVEEIGEGVEGFSKGYPGVLNPTFDDKVTFCGEASLVIGASTSVGHFATYQVGKTIYSAVTSIEAEDAAFACLAKDDKLAVAVTQPKPRDDVETTGRTVYAVFGAPHIPPNKGSGLILWKNLPRLFQQGVFVESISSSF